jgi:hypothetical protein
MSTIVSTRRHLRTPFHHLLEKRQYDRIMDVLLKERSSTALFLWLEGKIPHNTPPSENTGESPLHRIAAVQPPGMFCMRISGLTIIILICDLDLQ